MAAATVSKTQELYIIVRILDGTETAPFISFSETPIVNHQQLLIIVMQIITIESKLMERGTNLTNTEITASPLFPRIHQEMILMICII